MKLQGSTRPLVNSSGRQPAKGAELIDRLLSEGRAGQYLLAILAGQIRDLVLAQAYVQAHGSSAGLATALGKPDWQADRLSRQAKSVSPAIAAGWLDGVARCRPKAQDRRDLGDGRTSTCSPACRSRDDGRARAAPSPLAEPLRRVATCSWVPWRRASAPPAGSRSRRLGGRRLAGRAWPLTSPPLRGPAASRYALGTAGRSGANRRALSALGDVREASCHRRQPRLAPPCVVPMEHALLRRAVERANRRVQLGVAARAALFKERMARLDHLGADRGLHGAIAEMLPLAGPDALARRSGVGHARSSRSLDNWGAPPGQIRARDARSQQYISDCVSPLHVDRPRIRKAESLAGGRRAPSRRLARHRQRPGAGRLA